MVLVLTHRHTHTHRETHTHLMGDSATDQGTQKRSFVSLPSRSVPTPRLLISAHDYRSAVLGKGAGCWHGQTSEKEGRKAPERPLRNRGHTHTHSTFLALSLRFGHFRISEVYGNFAPVRGVSAAPPPPPRPRMKTQGPGRNGDAAVVLCTLLSRHLRQHRL